MHIYDACAPARLFDSCAQFDVSIGLNQEPVIVPGPIGNAQCQHLRRKPSDHLRRKVDDPNDQATY